MGFPAKNIQIHKSRDRNRPPVNPHKPNGRQQRSLRENEKKVNDDLRLMTSPKEAKTSTYKCKDDDSTNDYDAQYLWLPIGQGSKLKFSNQESGVASPKSSILQKFRKTVRIQVYRIRSDYKLLKTFDQFYFQIIRVAAFTRCGIVLYQSLRYHSFKEKVIVI